MLRISTLLTFCFVIASAASAGDWTSFQNGGRISQPADQSVTLGDVQWVIDLPGYGQSAPIVWQDRVYVTTVEGDQKQTYRVTAYQLSNGDRLWQQSVQNASPGENNNYVSRAAPSPAADQYGLICFFEGGNVVALTHDGEVRWQRNLVDDYGPIEARHGLSSSLEQDADSVFVWVERSTDPFLLSLNKQSGETEWKTNGLGSTSWSTPRLVPVGDGHHLVASASGKLAGFDPNSGKRLWLFEGISGNTVPTPQPLGHGSFLIGATVGRGESGGGRAAESNGVISITQSEDGQWQADYVWKAKRATSSFASPIVHGDTAYFVNREGVLYGLNAETGEEEFAKRLKGSAWATPIGVGSDVFFFCRDGKVNQLTEQKLSTWDQLPKPETAEAAEESQQQQRGPGAFSGSVLYAASWCGDQVLLRQGDRLASVAVIPAESPVEADKAK